MANALIVAADNCHVLHGASSYLDLHRPGAATTAIRGGSFGDLAHGSVNCQKRSKRAHLDNNVCKKTTFAIAN